MLERRRGPSACVPNLDLPAPTRCNVGRQVGVLA